MAEVAAAMGGRTGSIYYRFASRDVLLIRLWVRSVQRFQQVAFAALHEAPGPDDALVAAACAVPDYCRRAPDEARALTLYRQDRLLIDCPAELRPEVASLNDHLLRLIDETATARYGRLTPDLRHLTRTAVQWLPYGLVRPFIGSSQPIPPWVTDAVAAGARSVLAVGDAWP